MQLTRQQLLIGEQVIKEIKARVGFLVDVGLDYLTLARATGTLSGGEAQRIRLATQIGSGLVGVAYILDEPSIGLHQRDNDKLLATLKHLKDLGNTLIVVEHDEDTMRAADYIVDIGPGAGEHGGEVVAVGNAEEIMKNKKSLTGAYLSGRTEKTDRIPYDQRCKGEQSEEYRREDPAWHHDLHYRCVRFRKEFTDQRDPLQTSGEGFKPCACDPG